MSTNPVTFDQITDACRRLRGIAHGVQREDNQHLDPQTLWTQDHLANALRLLQVEATRELTAAVQELDSSLAAMTISTDAGHDNYVSVLAVRQM